MRFKLAFLATLFFGIFGMAQGSQAATYYVDATGGNDANNGTAQSAPWKTIAKVNSSSFSPGDNVLFKREETWRGKLWIVSSGTAGYPITFGSYGTGNNPIINPSILVTNFTGPDENGVYKAINSSSTFLVFEDGVALKKATTSACSDGNWYFNTNILYYRPTFGAPRDHIIEKTWAFPDDAAIAIYNSSYITVQDFTIKESPQSIVFGSQRNYIGSGTSFSNIIIKNNTLFNSGISGYINKDNVGSNIQVVNNTIDGCHAGITFLHWYPNTAGDAGYFTDVTVSGNTITNLGSISPGHTTWLQAVGSQLDIEGISSQEIKNAIWENNTITGDNIVETYNYRNPIVIYSGTTGLVKSTNIKIRNNLISYGRTAITLGLAVGNGGLDDITINNNIINHSSIYGFIVNQANNVLATKTNYFSNNIISDANIGIYFYQNPGNWQINNNIIDASLYHFQTHSSGVNSTADYNIYVSTGNKFNPNIVGARNFNQWKEATGWDSHSLNVNPLFVNASAGNFTLLPTSPAINAGVDVGLTSDYAGNPIVGAPDIGAYEYQGAVASAPSSDTTPPAAPIGLAVN